MIQFGTGELVTRLRRALDIRGKPDINLDDMVVPVVIVGEFQRAPFRTSGIHCFQSDSIGPGAGNFGRFRIENFDNPTDAVLVRVWLSNLSAAATQEFRIGTGPLALGGGTASFTTELVPDPVFAGIPSRTVPILLSTDQPGVTSITQRFIDVIALPGTTVMVPLELTIPALSGTITIESSTTQEPVGCAFEARLLTDLPGLPLG